MNRSLLAVAAVVAVACAASAQVVPGLTVEHYANAPVPVELTFDPTGVLYVGQGGSTGAPPLSVTRIGVGGSPVGAWGQPVDDPDAVLYDAAGLISGMPGSVIVSGYNAGEADGSIWAIRPDQSVVTLFGPSTGLKNGNSMAFDSLGRVILADDGDGEVWAFDGSSATLLFTNPNNANGTVAVDTVLDRIYTAPGDGTIRAHDLSGNELFPGGFVTGLSPVWTSPLALGNGGIWGTDLYAIDRGLGQLLRIDSAGNTTVIGTGFGNNSDDLVADLEFGPDGALYLSFLHRNEIIRIVPEPSALALLVFGVVGLLRRR